MRTTLRPARTGVSQHSRRRKDQEPSIPLLSMLIFSAELVLGPESVLLVGLTLLLSPPVLFHTNCADDRRAAELELGLVFGVELRQPLNTGSARTEMLKSVSHGDRCSVCEIEKCV